MRETVKSTTIGAGVLLIMPLIVWFSGWRWSPHKPTGGLKIAYWLTETVTSPWGIVTHLVLCGWFLWCLRFSLKPALMLFMLLSGVIIIGQQVKAGIKYSVQEPRPFVVWLEESQYIPVAEFYHLRKKQRGALVKRQLEQRDDIPVWLQRHWQKETGFSFPSGHSTFAASWALLSVGLLWSRRKILTISLLFVWATGVMGSRLLLGMHWPRDLVAAIILSWALITLSIWISQKIFGSFIAPSKEINPHDC